MTPRIVPPHVTNAIRTFASHAKRWAPAVLVDPRVPVLQWMLETDFARSAVYLGGQHRQPIPANAVPTYNLAGMVRHAVQFDGAGTVAIYRAGRVHQGLAGATLVMPRTTSHHDGRQQWPRFQNLNDGALGWAIRIAASPKYEQLRAQLRSPAVRGSWERQCQAIGESGWAQSKYRDPRITGAAIGSHLTRLFTEYGTLIDQALKETS